MLSIELSTIATGVGGFAMSGVAPDHAGIAIDGVDVDADGFADVIIGADRANGSTGAAYVVLGVPTGPAR